LAAIFLSQEGQRIPSAPSLHKIAKISVLFDFPRAARRHERFIALNYSLSLLPFSQRLLLIYSSSFIIFSFIFVIFLLGDFHRTGVQVQGNITSVTQQRTAGGLGELLPMDLLFYELAPILDTPSLHFLTATSRMFHSLKGRLFKQTKRQPLPYLDLVEECAKCNHQKLVEFLVLLRFRTLEKKWSDVFAETGKSIALGAARGGNIQMRKWLQTQCIEVELEPEKELRAAAESGQVMYLENFLEIAKRKGSRMVSNPKGFKGT